MKKYAIDGLIIIGCYAEIEADSEEKAIKFFKDEGWKEEYVDKKIICFDCYCKEAKE